MNQPQTRSEFRQHCLAKFGPPPEAKCMVDSNGTWRINTNTPEVQTYFAVVRRELNERKLTE